jgi:hypothetical protein
MTKTETKYQLERVEKALRLLQKKMNTNYHFLVGVMLPKDKEALGPESIMCVYNARGQEDTQAWRVDIDVAETAALKWREVLNHLYHETAHVFVGPMAALIPSGRTEVAKKRIIATEENVAYQLGRVFQLLIHGNIVERQTTITLTS